MTTLTETILRQHLRYLDSKYLNELDRLGKTFEDNGLDYPLYIKTRIRYIKKRLETRRLIK